MKSSNRPMMTTTPPRLTPQPRSARSPWFFGVFPVSSSSSLLLALRIFKDNAQRVRAMEAEKAQLAKKAETDRNDVMRNVADGFEKAVGNIIKKVTNASSDIEIAAGSLTKTAETTQELSASVAAASQQSSSNVQSAAAAAEEMASSVSEIGRQVQLSQTITKTAVQQAEKTNVQIAELSQSASRIGEVVKMITGVAEQTNLLALN